MNLRLEMTMEQMIESAALAKLQPSRPAASRKLLARKAIERAPLQEEDTLEANFPACALAEGSGGSHSRTPSRSIERGNCHHCQMPACARCLVD